MPQQSQPSKLSTAGELIQTFLNYHTTPVKEHVEFWPLWPVNRGYIYNTFCYLREAFKIYRSLLYDQIFWKRKWGIQVWLVMKWFGGSTWNLCDSATSTGSFGCVSIIWWQKKMGGSLILKENKFVDQKPHLYVPPWRSHFWGFSSIDLSYLGRLSCNISHFVSMVSDNSKIFLLLILSQPELF